MVKVIVILFVAIATAGSTTAKSSWQGPYKGSTDDGSKLPPIVFVPGTGGMQIEAKVNKPKTVGWYCTKKTDSFFTLWLDIKSLFPYAINCWMDNMRLSWDLKTMTASNSPGVETRVPGFGDTKTIEYLDSLKLVKYFAPMIDYLVSLGYKKGVNLRAAPYDFRYTPGTQPHNYYPRLKTLVEESYETSGGKKVVLLSHSYGAMITMQFLHSVSDAWKKQYISKWISISGVFGGTMKQVLLYASGDNFGIPNVLVNPLKIRDEQRTSTSNIFMLPIRQLWKDNEVLVKTKKRTYTIADLDDYFKDVGFPEGMAMLKKVGDGSSLMKPVGVPVTCFYGNISKSTEGVLIYEDEFPDAQPKITKEDGDGTVNLRSLEYCMNLKNLQREPVDGKAYDGQTHNGLFEFKDLQKDVYKKLLE